MYPTLLSIGPLHFHAYAIFLSVGFLAAVLLSVRENYRLPNPYPITPLGGLWVFLGGLLGARLYYIAQYGDLSRWYEAAYIWSGGLVFYGGAIGGFVGGVIYVLLVRASVVGVGDMAITYVPLAHAIARVGCFLNGCCWGSSSAMPWAVSYPHNSAPWKKQLQDSLINADAPFSLPVHPTQLYETGSLLLIFIALRILYRRPHLPGSVMLAYLFLYGFSRFLTEAFRGDSARHLLDMTVSQYVAIGLMGTATAVAALLWVTVWRRLSPVTPQAEAIAKVDTPPEAATP